MSREAIDHEAICQIAFDQRYAVPAAQAAQQLFGELPRSAVATGELVDTLATAHLIALLESMCIRELQAFIDPAAQTIVGAAVSCRQCAPVTAGALLRVSGWVERLADDEVTFHVQVQDEQERVCDASIRLAIVQRACIARRLTRKREAIARREIFLAA